MLFFVRLFCLCLNDVGLLCLFGSCDFLSHRNWTANHDTVPSHETRYFAIIVNFKKCLTNRFSKKILYVQYVVELVILKAVLCIFPTRIYILNYHLQTDDKPLCMTNQQGQNQNWVSHYSFHIPSSRIYVDSLIVQIKLTLRSLFN